MYIIVEKSKFSSDGWKGEKFLTGGRMFKSFKEAQKTKGNLIKMNRSILYKVKKI